MQHFLSQRPAEGIEIESETDKARRSAPHTRSQRSHRLQVLLQLSLDHLALVGVKGVHDDAYDTPPHEIDGAVVLEERARLGHGNTRVFRDEARAGRLVQHALIAEAWDEDPAVKRVGLPLGRPEAALHARVRARRPVRRRGSTCVQR